MELQGASGAPEGLHGSVTRDFTEFGFQGKWKLEVNANVVPTGGLAGKVTFTGVDLPLADYSTLSAQPTYLETSANTACVVGEVETFKGDWGYTPVLVVVNVLDVPDAPDLFSMLITLSPIDPAFACSLNPPAMQITEGNFTIIGS